MQPKWYKLKSKRQGGKKKDLVSGEVQMQFTIVDSQNPTASPEEIYKRFRSVIAAEAEDDDNTSLSRSSTFSVDNDVNDNVGRDANADQDDDDEGKEDESSTSEEQAKPEVVVSEKKEKKDKKQRMARLRRKSIAVRAYEFIGKNSDLSGIIFMEILRITDLPPERNSTYNGFRKR